MTPELHTHVLTLQMATGPLWSWYTRQVTEVKNQFHAIDYAISMVLPLEEERNTCVTLQRFFAVRRYQSSIVKMIPCQRSRYLT